jgi:hypothetical protein
MLSADRAALGRRQHAGKWARLAKPPRHGCVAAEKIGDFASGQAFQDPPPFAEAGTDVPAIARHPAAKVRAGGGQRTRTAAQLRRDPSVFSRIDLIDPACAVLEGMKSEQARITALTSRFKRLVSTAVRHRHWGDASSRRVVGSPFG